MRFWSAALLCAGIFAFSGSSAPAAPAAKPFAALHFRNIGPTTGRIDAVAGVPGDPTVYFAGGLGGLWRTKDAGIKWDPVFDDKDVTSIGAIAVAPSNHRIVYVGTGEPNIRNDIAFGNGVYRSDDGGTTWKHIGLDDTSQIGKIVIDPKNADVAYVAALGDPFASSADRGVFKTTDGGTHWTHSLYVNGTTGAANIAMSPGNPRLLLAGMWTVRREPWMLTSGGPGDGLYRSTDGGAHWTYLRGNGLPGGLMGRIGVAFAPSNPKRVYALIESKSGVLWRSDDSGATWHFVSDDHTLAQRQYYFSQLFVDPRDENHVYFMSIVASESKNGGKTVHRIVTNGYDHHQMWIDPRDAGRMIIGADAGVRLSQDGGKDWRDPQLIVSQPYHIAVDHETPYVVCGEFQDPGAVCGPSLSFTGAITPDQWFSAQSGESGWIVFSPANENMIYGTGYQEAVLSFDRKSGQGRLISPWPDTYSGMGAESYKYRGAWVAPVAVSPLEPKALYFGAQMLMRTDDGGTTWTAISPDLTRNEKSKQVPSGSPITRDNAGTEVYDTIASISESPTTKGEIWVGTDDGLAWLTRDGGAHWENLTSNIPGLPHYARVNNIDPSPFEDGTAYLVAENHKLGDRTPYLYVTRDYGAHWKSISGNLPRTVYARMVREDPVRKGMLYAGTENGLWVSFDDGGSWQSLLNNLPHAPVYDFVVQPQFDDLVVATHGRGVWILDDISALQSYTPAIGAQISHLFPIRNAYRWEAAFSTWATGEGAGDNPEGVADINFFLRDAPSKKNPVRLEIYDGTTLIRTLKVEHAVAGVNRAWWDLAYDPVDTVPKYHTTQQGFSGPTVAPGTYTVRLVGAGPAQEQKITVLVDPKSSATLADMQAQVAMTLRLRGEYQKTGAAIVALRSLSDQAAKLEKRASGRDDTVAALRDLHARAQAVLAQLYQNDTQTWEDTLRVPVKLYERISSLGGAVQSGDYAPTASSSELAAQLESELAPVLDETDALFGHRLVSVNALLARDKLPEIVVKRDR
ncbi:MAG: hypothetical protein ABI282_00105 [Candidatus Baltobacteraceae bacterium]